MTPDLDHLLTLTGDEQVEHLTRYSAPEMALLQLCDEAEQSAYADPGRAVEATSVLVALADYVAQARGRARARRAHAQTLAYAGQFHNALSICEQAITIAADGNERVELARARLASIHSLAHLGRFEEAIATGETARAILLDQHEPSLAARADLNLGAVQAMRDNPRTALHHFDRARPAIADDPLLRAQLDTNRGNALTALDEFEAAEQAYRDAAAGFEHGGHHSAAMLAEGNLAWLATRQGLLQTALHHFERARRLLEGNDAAAGHARLLAEQADALLVLGMAGEAADTYRDVLPELERLQLITEAAHAWFGLGRALIQTGDLAGAQSPLTRAADAYDHLGLSTDRARVDHALAELAAAEGERSTAVTLARRALTGLGERLSDAAAVHALLAHLAIEIGDLDSATGELAAGFATAERLRLSPLLSTLHVIQAQLHLARGEKAQARENLTAAIDEIERVRGTLQAERFRSAYLGTRLAPYEELTLMALAEPDETGLAEAFTTVERGKSRSLLDRMAPDDGPLETALSTEPDASLSQQRALLRRTLNWHYSTLANQGPGNTRVSHGVLDEIARVEADLERLENRIATTNAPSSVLTPTTLAEVQASLSPRTALLAFFVAANQVRAFSIRSDSIVVTRNLVSLTELEQMLHRLQFQIGRGLTTRGTTGARADRLLADMRRELSGLNSVLFAPLRFTVEGADQVIIVPHGSLHAVPFHAFWNGENYLLDEVAVSYAPSASVFAHLMSRSISAKHSSSLIVGVADELVPGIPGEVERVATQLPDATVVQGSNATVEQVIAAMKGSQLLHFACHGHFSSAHPTTSGLKLHDRWLTPREIAALSLTGAHVTLSACETGRARVSAGDELEGLNRAFFTAGASSILASLWPVHDATAVDLMTEFYRQRQNQISTSQALRTAQIATRQHHAHPALWAPFILGGHP